MSKNSSVIVNHDDESYDLWEVAIANMAKHNSVQLDPLLIKLHAAHNFWFTLQLVLRKTKK